MTGCKPLISLNLDQGPDQRRMRPRCASNHKARNAWAARKQNVLFDTQVLYIETIIYNFPEPPDEKVVNGTLINWLDKAVMARLRASHHLLALCPRTDFSFGIDIHRREIDPTAG